MKHVIRFNSWFKRLWIMWFRFNSWFKRLWIMWFDSIHDSSENHLIPIHFTIQIRIVNKSGDWPRLTSQWQITNRHMFSGVSWGAESEFVVHCSQKLLQTISSSSPRPIIVIRSIWILTVTAVTASGGDAVLLRSTTYKDAGTGGGGRGGSCPSNLKWGGALPLQLEPEIYLHLWMIHTASTKAWYQRTSCT